MGFLDRLLGRGDESKGTSRSNARVESSTLDDWVDVYLDDRRYHCTYTKNGPWLAANQGSSSHTGPSFFLFENGRLRYAKRITRPQEAALASNGTVAVPDWHTPDEDLIGTLYVIAPDGTIVLQHTFDANLGPVAITDDGRYVAAATYNPDCSTYIFDRSSGELFTRHEHLDGNKQGLSFEREGEDWRLNLHEQREGPKTYAIDLEGAVVWMNERLRRLRKVHDVMSQANAEDVQPKEVIEQLAPLYDDLEGNDRRNLAEKLGDAHWKVARGIKKQDGVNDACWGHLNSAYRYYTETLPWYGGKQGVAKVRRLMGKHLIKAGKEDQALSCFKEIAELEEEFDVSLLTDADKRRIEELQRGK